MRDYAKVAPQFWTGRTGRAIRAAGRDAQVIAFYLITCPSATMIGLYYLPLPTLCHETGIPLQGASKALRRLFEGGFAYYDEASETVFVPEMAKFQIGETLKSDDNRVKAIIKELLAAKSSPFVKDFHAKYAEAYHLPPLSDLKPLQSPFEGPSEPLRSQEQEQEQEQENTTTSPDGDPHGPLTSSNGHHPLTVEALAQLYNELAPAELPRVVRVSDDRRKKANRYLRQFPDREFWTGVFTELQHSPLLRGLRPSPGHEGFRGTFDWLLTRGKDGTENAVKVAEGRYRDRRAATVAEDDDDDAA